jgi:hypothetical protein
MPFFKTLATGLAGRTAGRRLARTIPNPLVRYAVMTAATVLAPMVARRVSASLERRKLARADRKPSLTGVR